MVSFNPLKKNKKAPADTTPKEPSIEEELGQFAINAETYRVRTGRFFNGMGERQLGRVLRSLFAIGVAAAIILAFFVSLMQNRQADLSDYAKQDASGVSAYATSFVKDFYTWDNENQDARGQALNHYNPRFANNTGWDGRGHQAVSSAVAVETTETEPNRYAVTVRFTTDSSTTPMYAQVHLYAANGSYSPLSLPALVATPDLPIPGITGNPYQFTSDEELTPLFTERLTVFFRAWSSGDTASVDAVAANGAKLGTNVGGQSFKAMPNVQIVTPASETDTTRTVLVTVTWEAPGGGEYSSNYKVDMVSENQRWVISSVEGAPVDMAAVVDSRDANRSAPSSTPTATATQPTP